LPSPLTSSHQRVKNNEWKKSLNKNKQQGKKTAGQEEAAGFPGRRVMVTKS
jgi:hypothetical protein